MNATFTQGLEALGAFESGKPSADPQQYKVQNTLGFTGKYPFGESLLSDLGYYKADTFYGNGAATNLWRGTWTDKAQQFGVSSIEDFQNSPETQEMVATIPPDHLIEGTAGTDLLTGTNTADQIFGYSGADIIQALGGNDIVKGGKGGDEIDGGAGDDQLDGKRGRDVIRGGTGGDFIYGGDGDDRLIGVDTKAAMPGINERDFLEGGSGKDIFVLGNKDKVFYRNGVDNTAGAQDYALILDFDPTAGDTIKLHGKASDYRLSQLSPGQGQAIYLKAAGQDELIAKVRGQVDTLDLTSQAFHYTVAGPGTLTGNMAAPGQMDSLTNSGTANLALASQPILDDGFNNPVAVVQDAISLSDNLEYSNFGSADPRSNAVIDTFLKTSLESIGADQLTKSGSYQAPNPLSWSNIR